MTNNLKVPPYKIKHICVLIEGTVDICVGLWASLVVQTVKHLSAVLETGARSLGEEDPLEKEMATYSSTLVWEIPWTGEPGRLQSTGSQRTGHY